MKFTTVARCAEFAFSLFLIAALQGCVSAPLQQVSSVAPVAVESKRLQTLFDEKWEEDMKRYPDWATNVGDNRYGDRLYDASPANEADAYAQTRRYLMQAQSLKREILSAKDRASLDIFVFGLQDNLLFEPLVGYRRMSLGAIGGFQSDFADLLKDSPVDKIEQVEQMLARMAAYPHRVDQELVRLREGLALGWVPPRSVLDRVIKTLDVQISASGDASPFFEPFTKLGKDISALEQDRLRQQARSAIADKVLPALRRLREFVAGDYAKAAPASGALGGYPGGAAVYIAAVRSQTTTDLSPEQIHAIGLREVARLRSEINKVMQEMKWQGDFASFAHYLNTDPQFFHTSPQELVASYREIAKRIDPELPRLFAELPRASYGIRAIPSHFGPDRAEYADPPALDGSRPGWFNVNAVGFRTRPKWGQETLTAHEAVPGHHLQMARAAELGELPKFRRSSWFTAYGEGWALYAETLGFDLGLYKDPASHFGHLQAQIFRAARLVVDTGIHAQGWSRQRAIDYMVEQTGDEKGFIESEVDRYTSWPGQALGYMIGELKILELRDRARTRLGERFDIRRFHMVLLDQGAVPLTVLERQVDEWIAAEALRL
jgi:uncharacterized protein (DUF885 family)